MSAINKMKIYVVVEVWRGMPEGTKTFRRLKDAQRYAQRLRRRLNPMSDEVAIFENLLEAPQ